MSTEQFKTWEVNGSIYSNKGHLRSTSDYVQHDLSHVRILHAGVDTFKQLVSGELNLSMLKLVEQHYESCYQIPLVLGSYQFLVSRSGSKSGFHWVLRNNDLGVILLLKSFYAESTDIATHIKIEYSPHLLLKSDPQDIDKISIDLSSMFMVQFQLTEVAVHLAVDVKGWEPDEEFEKHLRAKAKRSYTFAGVSEFDFDINAVAVKYGTKESFTFGSAGSLQLCVYDKTKEMQSKDKAAFWTEQWLKTPGVEDPFVPEFEFGDRVTRIEYRFHHNVIKQFRRGTQGFEATNFVELAPHLTHLYAYGLNNFRLHYTRNYIDPVWQMLMSEVVIWPPHKPLFYKREYKGDSSSSRRNVAFWLGNAMRLFARQQFNVDYVVNYFMQSGLLRDLKAYCKMPPNATDDELFMVLHELVRKRMEQHILNGVHN